MVKAKNGRNDRERSGWHPIVVFTLLQCLFTLAFSLYQHPTTAQTIAVGLQTTKQNGSVLFSPKNGAYVLLNEDADTIYRFRSDDAMSVTAMGDQLQVRSPYGLNSVVTQVRLIGMGTSPTFRLRMNDDKNDLEYLDDLTISANKGQLRMVDHVSIERYVGRVVQCEVGHGAEDEYYKIQSIICRTYATRHLARHASEGYDLCDSEHCQVFSGLKKTSDEVIRATSATSGLVMVDPNEQLILSAFHANCGGQTANSEDVWKESRSYLTSVNDTFCLKARSATWERSIPLGEMLAQLGFNADTTGSSGWKFEQAERRKFFVFGKDSIETAQMRRLLQLRSTYFDVHFKNGKAVFNGRGYGHGVGLCQQGAMRMAQAGYTYSQILGYYYKGVSLIPFTALKP